MRSAAVLISASSLISSTVFGYTYDCANFRVDNVAYNFEKLKGPHSITLSQNYPPTFRNTTYTLDICQGLKKNDTIPKDEQCSTGTYVCRVQKSWESEDDQDKKVSVKVIPIAGLYVDDGSGFNPKFTPLNGTESKTGGMRLEIHGPKYNKQKQKAIIDFLCDKERTGNEMNEENNRLKPRDSEEDGDDGNNGDSNDGNSSLKFVSYGPVDDYDVLKLNWRSKYACADYNPDDDDDNGENGDDTAKKGGWGFFTWFIVLLFLGTSAYLIFGSWLNYNRYGARGWDLLPHGDTIRDVPYIFKDFSRKVLDTFSGSGSRGGYSAV